MKDLDTSAACFQRKCITAFFYAVFAISLAAQFFTLVQEAGHPTELKTTMNKEPLSTFDDFPLLGRICVKNGLDVKKLRYSGYSDPSGFYMEVSRYNDSIFGWSGHMENGSVTDLTAELLAVDKLSDFVSEIKIVCSMNNTPNVLTGQEMDSLVSEVIIVGPIGYGPIPGFFRLA